MPLHSRYSKIVAIIITIDLNVSVSFPQIIANFQGIQNHITEKQGGDTRLKPWSRRNYQDVVITDKQG